MNLNRQKDLVVVVVIGVVDVDCGSRFFVETVVVVEVVVAAVWHFCLISLRGEEILKRSVLTAGAGAACQHTPTLRIRLLHARPSSSLPPL